MIGSSSNFDSLQFCSQLTYRDPQYLFGKISSSLTNPSSMKRTKRIFNTSFALSKWPHLHRAYVISGCAFFWLAIAKMPFCGPNCSRSKKSQLKQKYVIPFNIDSKDASFAGKVFDHQRNPNCGKNLSLHPLLTTNMPFLMAKFLTLKEPWSFCCLQVVVLNHGQILPMIFTFFVNLEPQVLGCWNLEYREIGWFSK